MNEHGLGNDNVSVGAGVGVTEHANWHPKWKIDKYNRDGHLYAIENFENNSLLNEGITELLALLIGGSATAFNYTNACIGVGDGTAAVVTSQTGLQGTNKAYRPMDATYPQVSNQTVMFRATFGASDGNFSWQEFTVANGSSDSAKNLNRKVENHGTKASGDTWVISCSVTIS